MSKKNNNNNNNGAFSYHINANVKRLHSFSHFSAGENIQLDIPIFDDCRIIVLQKAEDGINVVMFDADPLDTFLECK